MLLSLERLRDDFTRALNRGGVLKFPLGENRTGGGGKGLRGKDRVTTSFDFGFGGRGRILGVGGRGRPCFVSSFPSTFPSLLRLSLE